VICAWKTPGLDLGQDTNYFTEFLSALIGFLTIFRSEKYESYRETGADRSGRALITWVRIPVEKGYLCVYCMLILFFV
jgi:hypothetical protein